LGCGSGRNSNFLKALGFNVLSFDKKSDYGIALDLGHDKMPNDIPTPDLILCNYLFCFMKANERKHLAEEINKVARPGCFLMVELYSGKKTYPYTTIGIKKMFPKHQWKTRHLIKDRFILIRTSADL
jgi:hypothetical protein